MLVPRPYRSQLRDQQVEQTRELILAAAIDMVADDSVTELTVAEAAARARVSVRTAYRYFPTKDALVDAVNAWFVRRWGPAPRYPARLDELPDGIRRLYVSFSDNERVLRASSRTPAARQARQRRKQQQVSAFEKMVEAEAPGLDPAKIRRMAGALHALVNADHYLTLRDHWGFSVEEATESTLWGIEAIAAELRHVARSNGNVESNGKSKSNGKPKSKHKRKRGA